MKYYCVMYENNYSYPELHAPIERSDLSNESRPPNDNHSDGSGSRRRENNETTPRRPHANNQVNHDRPNGGLEGQVELDQFNDTRSEGTGCANALARNNANSEINSVTNP